MPDHWSDDDPLGAAAACLARIRSGAVTIEDETSLAAWRRNEENERALVTVISAWKATGELRDDPRVLQMREQARRRGRRPAWWVLAGATAAAASLTAGVYLSQPSHEAATVVQAPVGTRYSAAEGAPKRIALADGSAIVLDADSVVETSYSSGARRLRLVRGRAFFQVAHDSRPFYVDGALFSVRATGTAFTIEHRQGRQHLSMLEGRVVAFRPGQEARVAVSVGHGLRARPEQQWQLTRVDVDRERGWMVGDLIFRDETVRAIVDEVNRYSRAKIIVDQPLGAQKLSAVLRAGEPEGLVSALTALDMATVAYRSPDRVSLKKFAPPAEGSSP